MRTVHEVSRLTGVSVRTLRYYDAIGLLRPAGVTDAGYRLYDDTSLSRLQSILLFRELRFSLRDIRAMLDAPDFNPREAVAQQIRLLTLERRRLDGLLALACDIQRKGVYQMDFDAFKQDDVSRYAQEVRERWGHTDAYRACQERLRGQSAAERDAAAKGLMACFAALGAHREEAPDAPAVQSEVDALRQYITDHYYPCGEETLQGLGRLYVEDERFRRAIDKAGGEGAAAFVGRAIAARRKNEG